MDMLGQAFCPLFRGCPFFRGRNVYPLYIVCLYKWRYYLYNEYTITDGSGGDVTISGDVTYDPGTQTLTCISTGGPATTVSWTRDSTPVTEGTTEMVLNDPVTAQYTHTLTLTGRLPGLYTCTVANIKPSSTSASITVGGKD